MIQSSLAIIILAFSIVTTTALRIAGTEGKNTIAHDEGISYLSATGYISYKIQDKIIKSSPKKFTGASNLPKCNIINHNKIYANYTQVLQVHNIFSF